ncbi:putative peptidoglycan binding protein [Jatrophihabitans sp. GAS493]|uniref:transglycosylase family protein n=1 Tax=Jatrophihabitans sp. GAS493 TaxID=1907575 RepID=UPI000BBFA280|nr:transglycosylase family protein [Jatrophihabitans sp. GAS493]SOD74751.1 putative peptidoglycan binding protein [Jatrophihabitans sp. GAS493]
MSQLLGPTSSLSFFGRTNEDEDSLEQQLLIEEAGEPVPAVKRWRRPRRIAAIVALATASIALVPLTSASADPSANAWYRLRMCESSNRYDINTGNSHYGAYQFDLSTWRSVGGNGYPNLASPAEQDKRALMLYRKRGWQPWQCARIIGLTNDSDARSGRTSDITVASDGSVAIPAKSKAPAWRGTRNYNIGDYNSVIAAWQVQMGKRGAPLVGTGQFGPKTVAAAKRLQARNGLPVTGIIGPNTWALAWNGKY